MEITFVIDRLPAEPGGAQKVLAELADRLAESHRLTVVVPMTTPRRTRREPVRAVDGGWGIVDYRPPGTARILSAPANYVSVPGLRRYGYTRAGLPAALLYGRVAGRALAADLPRRPELVHAFTADMTAHLALGLGKAADAPVVCTGFPHPGHYGDGPVDSSAYRRADGVVALTGHDRAVYERLGVPDERIAVIPPPSDDLGMNGRDAARRRLGIDGPLVLFAGVRRDYKGASILHQAVPSIAPRIGNLTVAFVGPGAPLRPVSGATIRDAGEVDAETMRDWIRAADVLVLPSQYEIFPVVVLEAWSAGVPAVLSDVPALRYLVEVSGGGVAIRRTPDAVAAAVIELLGDEALRNEVGASGRQYWEAHCTMESILNGHEDLYTRLVHAHGVTSGNARQR
jgi:glycosyltransferase involved in cell wall biosynthesis